MSKKIIVIGAGGHAQSVIDAIQSKKQYQVAGIIDKQSKANYMDSNILLLGEEKGFSYFYNSNIRYAAIGIGSIGNVETRQHVFYIGKSMGFQFPNIVDHSAVLAKNVRMGEANFVGKGAILNANVSIRNVCIINTGAIIEHGCSLDDFVHAAPGCVILGNVKIGKNSHIGANATIMQNVKIGDNVVIGAGSLVVSDIASNYVAYGCPAKEVRIWKK